MHPWQELGDLPHDYLYSSVPARILTFRIFLSDVSQFLQVSHTLTIRLTDELLDWLKSVARVLSLIEDDMLRLALDCSRNIDRLAELGDRYYERAPDFADLCLIRMSELFPRHTIVTADESDFRVYRRNRRETIPLLCPPRAK
jgi:hypothetical protein